VVPLGWSFLGEGYLFPFLYPSLPGVVSRQTNVSKWRKTRDIMSEQNGNVALEAPAEFDHINIMDIDPTFKPIDPGFYTLQVNKITPKVTEPKSGKNVGKSLLMLNGSFTVVNHENFAGRKLWKTFWTNNPVDLKDLRRLADATGVTQSPDQTLSEYVKTFEELAPPAEFNIFIGVEADYRDPNTMVNSLKFNQAQPVA
jgi:hypothetical protein